MHLSPCITLYSIVRSCIIIKHLMDIPMEIVQLQSGYSPSMLVELQLTRTQKGKDHLPLIYLIHFNTKTKLPVFIDDYCSAFKGVAAKDLGTKAPPICGPYNFSQAGHAGVSLVMAVGSKTQVCLQDIQWRSRRINLTTCGFFRRVQRVHRSDLSKKNEKSRRKKHVFSTYWKWLH